ncbi:MAG: sigma-70 family RNA polymerase sigma factor [Myxococcales bacterium]|nr:sigma-70 family RNA polymerase sigma factor [Myxococcales bacterium]
MALAAAGDREAFGVVVRRHGPAVLRVAAHVTGSQAAAADVFQETFLAAFRAAGSYRGAGLRAWLFTIARNAAYRSRRAQGREEQDASLMELGASAGWGDVSPEIAFERSERLDRVRRAFAMLSTEDREILALRDVEGLSGEDAATVTGLSLQAMKSRLHRARLRLGAAYRDLVPAEGEPNHDH